LWKLVNDTFGEGSISGLNVRLNQIAQKVIGDSNKTQNLITQLKVEFDEFANPNLEKAKEPLQNLIFSQEPACKLLI